MRALFAEIEDLAVIEVHFEGALILSKHRARTKNRVAKTLLMPEWFHRIFRRCRITFDGDVFPVGIALANRRERGGQPDG